MLLRRFAGALTAVAIVMAPTMAVAQQAPAPAATYETGAAQLADDDDDFPLIWILGGIGLAVLLYFLLKGDKDDDEELPTSP